MSLQYKTQVYIRKAIRQARFHNSAHGVWSASLPAFELEATGDSRDDAEENLLITLAAYVARALDLGWPLPAIDGVDLAEEPGADDAVGVGAQTTAGPAPEVIVLSARESRMVAQALDEPPAPNDHMLNAAREYREYMSH